MAFDRTAASNFLKTVYSEPIVDQLVRHTDCLDLFTQRSEAKHSRQGHHIEVSSYYQDPQGVGARAEGDYLPQPTNPAAVSNKIYLKYQYMLVQLTRQVMIDMERGPAAFANWATVTLQNIVKALKDDLDRQIVGIGAGAIGQVNENPIAVADGALTVDNAFGLTGVGKAVHYFKQGQRIKFASSIMGTTLREAGVSYAVVEAVDFDGNEIYLADQSGTRIPTNVANNDFIFRGDGAGNSAKGSHARNKEIMGLLGHIDDGTNVAIYFGLNRSDRKYGFLKSQRINGSANGGNFTEAKIMKAYHRLRKHTGGMPTHLIGSYGVWRNFFNEVKGGRSLNDPRSYEVGAKGLIINIGPARFELRIGNRIPDGHCFMLDTSTLERGQTKGIDWDDTTGSIWKQVQDSTGVKDENFAFGSWFLETYNNSPWKSCMWHGLAES